MQTKSYCNLQGHEKYPIILICLNQLCCCVNRKVCNKCLNQHSDCQQKELLFDEVVFEEKYYSKCQKELNFKEKINFLVTEYANLQTQIVDTMRILQKKLQEIEDKIKRQEQEQMSSLRGFEIQQQMIQKLVKDQSSLPQQLQQIKQDYNKIKEIIIEKLGKFLSLENLTSSNAFQNNLERSQIRLLSSSIQNLVQNPQLNKQYKLPKIGDVKKIIVREKMLIAQLENQINIYEKSILTLSLNFQPNPQSIVQIELSDHCRHLVISCHNQIKHIKFSLDLKNSINHQVYQSTYGIKQILFINNSTIFTLQENNTIISYNLDPFAYVFTQLLKQQEQIVSIDYCQNLDLLMIRNNQIAFYDFKQQQFLYKLDDGEYQLAKFTSNSILITIQFQKIYIWKFQDRTLPPIKQEVLLNFDVIDIYPTEDDVILQTKENNMISLNDQDNCIQTNCQNKLIAASSVCVLKNEILFASFNKNQIIDKFINVQTYQLWNK